MRIKELKVTLEFSYNEDSKEDEVIIPLNSIAKLYIEKHEKVGYLEEKRIDESTEEKDKDDIENWEKI